MKQALISVFRNVFAAEQQAQVVKPAAPAVLSLDALREVSGGSPRGTWNEEQSTVVGVEQSPRGTW